MIKFNLLLYKNNMLFYDTPTFTIAFGDKQTSFPPRHFYDIGDSQLLLKQAQFEQIAEKLQLTDIVVLKQTHSTLGFAITNTHDQFLPYQHEGDYLVTALPRIGLAVATADCLPIVMYDKKQHIIANIHAGWKGSVQSIAVQAVETMKKTYDTQPGDLAIYFGPSAKTCCYQVDEQFITNLQTHHYDFNITDCIILKNSNIFFDVPRFNMLQLVAIGIEPSAMINLFNECTICTTSYCSYRRDGAASERQMTIVALK